MSDSGTGTSSPMERPTPGWMIVSYAGSLVLGRSAYEFAVYDASTVFGRWPLSPDGERYARETYEAHRQSLAHGLAIRSGWASRRRRS
jgi:hypothetical protein